MMEYKGHYPNLVNFMQLMSPPWATEQEFKSLLRKQTKDFPELKMEIRQSFGDEGFSWMEILNLPDIGEVIDAETEEEAREFAAEMFLSVVTD